MPPVVFVSAPPVVGIPGTMPPGAKPPVGTCRFFASSSAFFASSAFLASSFALVSASVVLDASVPRGLTLVPVDPAPLSSLLPLFWSVGLVPRVESAPLFFSISAALS